MIVGTPRNTSAYTIARNRIGRNCRPGSWRTTATTSAQIKHEDLGDDEELDVPPEPADQRGAARPDERPVEQHAAHERVVGREEERAERDHRGHEPETEHVEQIVGRVLGGDARVEEAVADPRAARARRLRAIARAPNAGTASVASARMISMTRAIVRAGFADRRATGRTGTSSSQVDGGERDRDDLGDHRAARCRA